MSAPTLTQLLIVLGDGGDPEVFAHPCGANTRSLKLMNNVGEELLLDCDDPLGAVATISRYVESQDTSMSLAGKVATESLAQYVAWSDDGSTKNIRAELHSAGGLLGHWSFPAILTEFEITGDGKKNSEFSASVVAAGGRSYLAA